MAFFIQILIYTSLKLLLPVKILFHTCEEFEKNYFSILFYEKFTGLYRAPLCASRVSTQLRIEGPGFDVRLAEHRHVR